MSLPSWRPSPYGAGTPGESAANNPLAGGRSLGHLASVRLCATAGPAPVASYLSSELTSDEARPATKARPRASHLPTIDMPCSL
jgi:hypothetical protein